MAKIAILDTGYKDYSHEEQLLEAGGYDLHIFKGDKSDASAKKEFSRDAIGIFVRWTEIDESFLKDCPDLSVIVRYGTGYENIDLDAATRYNVKVSNVGGYGNHSVSDHALSLIYASIRGLFKGVNSLRSNFGKPPFERIFELHRKTLGIIGLGRIGGTLAGKAKHLFKEVIATDPYIPDTRFEELGVKKVSLSELLHNSDVISIHCNLNDETKHLLDHEAFNKLARVPVLVNTARGPVIKTDAMVEALDAGKIFCAGIDVYDSELAGEIPESVLTHPRIISTGHYAWFSENSISELQKRAASNMLSLLKEEEIEDSLN